MRIFELLEYSNVTFSNLVLTRGSAKELYNPDDDLDGRGGAISIRQNAAATLRHCELIENSADIEGGAIASAGTLYIENCTFALNEAPDDG